MSCDMSSNEAASLLNAFTSESVENVVTVDSLTCMKESTLRASRSLIDPSVSRLKFSANHKEKASPNLRMLYRYAEKLF